MTGPKMYLSYLLIQIVGDGIIGTSVYLVTTINREYNGFCASS